MIINVIEWFYGNAEFTNILHRYMELWDAHRSCVQVHMLSAIKTGNLLNAANLCMGCTSSY
ncbi:hypothetical protein D3C85_1818370 [compost metagenome]